MHACLLFLSYILTPSFLFLSLFTSCIILGKGSCFHWFCDFSVSLSLLSSFLLSFLLSFLTVCFVLFLFIPFFAYFFCFSICLFPPSCVFTLFVGLL
jgi:hypothetical protein